MPVELPALPYLSGSLQPHLSAQTVELHHGRHHRAYVDAVNAGTLGTEWEEASLEEIVRQRPSLQAKFDARLAKRLQDQLGYRIEHVQYNQSGRLKSG